MKAFITRQIRYLSHAKRQFSLFVWPSFDFFWTTSLWVAAIIVVFGSATTYLIDPASESLVIWLKSTM